MSYTLTMHAVDPAELRARLLAVADTAPERLEAWAAGSCADEDYDASEWAHEALGLVRARALTEAEPRVVHSAIAWALTAFVAETAERVHDDTWSRGFWDFVVEDLARLWGRPDLAALLLERGLFGATGEGFPACGWLAPEEAAACLAAWDATGEGLLEGVSEDEAAVWMTDALRTIAAAGRHAVFVYG